MNNYNKGGVYKKLNKNYYLLIANGVEPNCKMLNVKKYAQVIRKWNSCLVTQPELEGDDKIFLY